MARVACRGMADPTVPATPGLLTLHAHPDDEVITTGGVLRRAVLEGRRVKVVTCTDGARGEVVGEGMDPEEVFPRLAEVRRGEMAAAMAALGVEEQEFLGYVDSGMMGTDGNDDPASFWQADTHEAIGRVVAQIRTFRPTVFTCYDAFGGYGHPDHIQVHRIGLLAVEAAAMAALYPEAGPAWRVPKVYFTAIPKSAIVGMNQAFLDRGLPSPFGEDTDPADIPMGTEDHLVTTLIDVSAHIEDKQAALKAHHSQISPESFFLNVPDDMVAGFYGTEAFVRVRSDVPVPDGLEDDLFAGIT